MYVILDNDQADSRECADTDGDLRGEMLTQCVPLLVTSVKEGENSLDSGDYAQWVFGRPNRLHQGA